MASGWELLATAAFSGEYIDSGVFAAKKYLKITVQIMNGKNIAHIVIRKIKNI